MAKSDYSYLSKLKNAETFISSPNPGSVKTALLYPNSYYTAMSSLGFQTIYALMDKHPLIRPNRFFYDTEASLEDNLKLSSCSVICVSLNFEPDVLNLLEILKKNGITLNKHKRSEKEPLIVIGGKYTLLNPFLLNNIADLFVTGEAEDIFEDIFNILLSYDKKEIKLDELKDMPGAFVPGKSTNYVSVESKDISKAPAHSHILTPSTEFSNKFLIEIGRGCTYSCRFCLMGNTSSLRNLPAEKVISLINKGMDKTSSFGLISCDVCSHPDWKEICSFILSNPDLKISVASLRANNLDLDFLKYLSSQGQKFCTVAPETGDELIRNKLKKQIKDDHILESAKMAKQCGFYGLKLYFMYGLPHETKETLDKTLELIKKTAAEIPMLKVSFNPFIPKPNTPFQWYNMNETKTLKQKQKFLKQSLKKIKNVTASFESINLSILQAIIAKATPNMAEDFESLTSKEIIKKYSSMISGNHNPAESTFYWDKMIPIKAKEQLQNEFLKSFQ